MKRSHRDPAKPALCSCRSAGHKRTTCQWWIGALVSLVAATGCHADTTGEAPDAAMTDGAPTNTDALDARDAEPSVDGHIQQDSNFRDASLDSGVDAGPTHGRLLWEPFELSFTAHDDHPWDTFPLTVVFTSANTRVQVDGYWAGGREWRVRFAPQEIGRYEWTSTSTANDPGLSGQSGSFDVISPTASQIAANPNLKGQLRVSSDGRYLVYHDGSPFLWIGDTFWAFNSSRATIEQGSSQAFYQWVDDRRRKGFTLLQISFVSKESNEIGPAFFGSWGEFSRLNPDSFESLDVRMRYAWESGFVVAGLPTWICLVDGLDLQTAKNMARYLLARYGAYNLIYILSGEYQYSANHNNLSWNDWDALGVYVAQHYTQGQMVTLHPSHRTYWPSPHNRQSSDAYHSSDWLSLNLLQTGQSRDRLYNIPIRCMQDYHLTPIKPVIHSEGWYEDTESGGSHTTTREDIRWQAYTAFLNGCAGHTYGDNAGWLFYNPTEDPYEVPSSWSWYHTPWDQGMAEPGSDDMSHVVQFFLDVVPKWYRLIPHRDWIRRNGHQANAEETDLHFPSLAALPGQVYAAYIPAGNASAAIRITHLQNATYNATWFDPRSGTTSPASQAPSGMDDWTIPNRPDPRNGDWLLLLSR